MSIEDYVEKYNMNLIFFQDSSESSRLIGGGGTFESIVKIRLFYISPSKKDRIGYFIIFVPISQRETRFMSLYNDREYILSLKIGGNIRKQANTKLFGCSYTEEEAPYNRYTSLLTLLLKDNIYKVSKFIWRNHANGHRIRKG